MDTCCEESTIEDDNPSPNHSTTISADPDIEIKSSNQNISSHNITNSDTKKKERNQQKLQAPKYCYFNPKAKNKCIGTTQNPIYLICDDFYANLCDKVEADKNKYGMFWELIKAYKLNSNPSYAHKLKIIAPSACNRSHLLSYHDESFVDLLEEIENFPSYSEQTEEEKESLREYGLMDDCPIFDGLWSYCLNVAGSSLLCAELIKSERTRIAINFGGGRHHSFSAKASGFCYVNDIILCIDCLRQSDKFGKICYIDLDLHHGDAVQEAYYHSDAVFVCSVHCKESGFWPKSGSKEEIGESDGKFYNLNVPISQCRLRDSEFVDIISKVCHRINCYFQPDAIVICGGCDALSSDPFNKFNLSINGLSKAVNVILTVFDLPTVILGEGGYNAVDTAKCWTKIVSIAANICLSNDIPFHSNFDQFAPHYLLNKVSKAKNEMVDKRSYLFAMQSVYAHLNNFERHFLTNLKRKCIENEQKIIENRKKMKMDEESKQIEEEEEEESDEDIDVDDSVNEPNEVVDNSQCVGSKRSSNNTTNTCRSRRKRRKLQ